MLARVNCHCEILNLPGGDAGFVWSPGNVAHQPGTFTKSHAISVLFFLFIITLTQAHSQWQSRRSDLPDWTIGWAIDACDSSRAVVSTTPGGIFRSADTGLHWEPLNFPAPLSSETAMDVSMPDSSTIWAATNAGKILFWQDHSRTWQIQHADTNATKFMNYIRMFDATHGIAMGDGMTDSGPALFLKTSDGGLHWISVNDSAFGGWSGDTWRRLEFVSPDTGYFFESGANPQKTYKTVDGCSHWSVVPLPDTLYAMAMKFNDAQVGLVYTGWYRSSTSNGLSIARTVDGGVTWEVYVSPSAGWGNDLEFAPGNPSKVWMTDNVKLYFSPDTGRTWSERGTPGGRDIIFTDELHGWVLGDNGVLLHTSNGGLITAAPEAPGRVSAGFSLAQNYPNPFNPTTVISYQLPVAANVRLVIYDLLGREVMVLVNEKKERGSHEIRFDGAGLASGVYLCRLTTSGFVQTRTMVLVR